MTCAHCKGVALRMVGRKGYCKAHTAEAMEAHKERAGQVESQEAADHHHLHVARLSPSRAGARFRKNR